MKNLDLFDDKQQRLIRSAGEKQDSYGDGFDKGNYFENVYPIVASGFSNAEQIVYCGAIHNGRSRPCRQWHLCSRCAYYKGTQALAHYESAFTKATFSHLTCSFDGDLELNSTNSDMMRIYWNAIESAIHRACKEGLIDGGYLVHELSIRSFLPLRVVPHSHVLISGEPLTPERMAVISGYISEAAGVELVPSLVSKPITNKEGYRKVIKYQTKAIRLQEPYNSALLRCGRGRLGDLNLELKEFLDSYSAAIDHFTKVVRFGNLRPKKGGGFIGAKRPKKRRKKYSDSRTIIKRTKG